MDARKLRNVPGFTLVELLVVIAIVATLMTIAFMVGISQLNKGKKVQVLGQFRELAAGMESFISENQKPPMRAKDLAAHTDVVYGDDGGNANSFIVAALRGETTQFPYKGEYADAKEANPTGQQYLDFSYSADKKKGVGPDGRLYDPWGRQILMAVNTPPYNEDEAEGKSDKLLYTWGKGEYTDTKPREQTYVFWSFGKDGKKGKNAPSITSVVPFAGSDDVISW